MKKALMALAIASSLACTNKPTPVADAGVDAGADAGPPLALGIPPQCNPLRGDDPLDCLTPWPSDTYEVAAAAMPSGRQLSVPLAALPSTAGVSVGNGRLNLADGFSPAGPIVFHFKEGVSSANLPTWEDLTQGLAATSPTQLLSAADGSRQLQFTEVDATNTPPRQALFIRPMKRLQPKSTYVVVLLDTLQSLDGGVLPVPAGMQALLDGTPTDNARLEAMRPSFQNVVLPTLQKAGIPTSSVLLAWSFTTGSDEALTANLVSMNAQALAEVGDGSGISYQIWSVQDGGFAGSDGGLYEIVTGAFEVPNFLVTDDGSPTDGGEALLDLDDGGAPHLSGQLSAHFVALVPTRILTATPEDPLPVANWGAHGLLGDAISSSQDPNVQAQAASLGTLLVMTDWSGLSSFDQGIVGQAATDFSQLPLVTDKLQQAVINNETLVRFARTTLAKDPLLQPNGQDVISKTEAYYWGNSLGGIMGNTFMAYDPDVQKAVLAVPGGCWSLLLQRSEDWAEFAALFQANYPDGVDQAFLLAFLQTQFDYSDPITTSAYVLGPGSITGAPPKLLAIQEGRWDMEVTNLSTEMTARTLGLPLLTPTDYAPYGLTPATAPQPSALTVYDTEPSMHPFASNALNTGDNGVHDGIWLLPAAQRQLAAFLTPDGGVSYPCAGDAGCICAAPTNACN